MENFASIMAPGPVDDSPARLARLADLGSGGECIAFLVDPGSIGLLRRWDDLLDEGVAAIFDLVDVKAELVALCFHAGKFTPAKAATWLSERGFTPLLVVPNSGSKRNLYFRWPLLRMKHCPCFCRSEGGFFSWRW